MQNALMKPNYTKLFDSAFWTALFQHPRGWLKSFVKPFRIGVAAANGFSVDDCSGKASALTFYSLLSIVPLLAVAFGIAKGFGFEEMLKEEVSKRFLDQPEITERLIDFAYKTLQNTQSGLIAGVGLLVLFWSVLQLLSTIESAFNGIWKVHYPRAFSRRFSDYLAMMLFCPIFFAVSSSLSVFVSAKITHFTEVSGTLKPLSPYIIFLVFHLFPLVLVWLLFTTLYYIMPNTKVPLSCALIGGILAGTAYHIVQLIYIKFQVGLSSYGAIYGSFAAIPLFLVWLNVSWLITLAGAEIAHHTESSRMHAYLSKAARQHRADARVLGFLIVQQCLQAFIKGDLPPTLYHFGQRAGVPITIVRSYVQQLVQAGLLVEVTWKDGSGGYYQPAKDVQSITLKTICDALDNARHEHYMMVYDQEVEDYEKALEKFDAVLDKAAVNVPLVQVVARRH